MVEDAGPSQQYMNQEGKYVHRLASKISDDGARTEPPSVGQLDALYLSDDEGAEHIDDEHDDEQAELVLSFAHNGYEDNLVKERTEWQAMLSNVLTGEIFRSEKSRLQVQGAETKPMLLLWNELKAKVACRSLNEQRRVLAVGRGFTHEVLDKIANFKPLPPPVTIPQAYAEIGGLLTLLDRCESLWPNMKAMRDYFPMYGSEELQKRGDAITAWHTVVESVYQEYDLLKNWTGNEEADPTKPQAKPDGIMIQQEEFILPQELPNKPDGAQNSGNSDVAQHQIVSQVQPSLVDTLLKQEGALQSIFENHIERYLFPLVSRAQDVMREYDSEFSRLGLPDINEVLGPLVAFPIQLIQHSMEERLNGRAKMYSPNAVMIDEAVAKFEAYLNLGVKLAKHCIRLGESIQQTPLNATMLRSIRFYLDLLSNKFLDGGSSSMSFFRSFKNIEQLDGHFSFLQVTCQLIEGGDISVAEQFCSLHLRILSRLLAYWEHQMQGPRSHRSMDINRWYADTCENIRGIHRKLMRFYKTLCNTYENASEFVLRPSRPQRMERSSSNANDSNTTILSDGMSSPNNGSNSSASSSTNNLVPGATMQDLVNCLRDHGYALVLPGDDSVWSGTYAFANRALREQPLVVKALLQGHSRPPLEHHEPGAVVLVTVNEALNWTGPVQQLASGAPLLHMQSQVRLVAQGGYHELQYVQMQQPKLFEEILQRTVARKSQLARVEMELHRMRSVWLRLMLTVLHSAIKFRRDIRKNRLDCMETVQVMMAFAHDFGERSLRLVPEVNRDRVVLKMFDFCLEWLDFVVDDCPPGDGKKFKWTVTALEFAMKMTKGVNVLALPEDQFSRLRSKVADCMAILIAHYDIMGARSKAANLTNHYNRVRLLQQAQTRSATMTTVPTPPNSGVPASSNTYGAGDETDIIESQIANDSLSTITESPSSTPQDLVSHQNSYNSQNNHQSGKQSSHSGANNSKGIGSTPVSPANSIGAITTGNCPSSSAVAALKDDDEVIAAHRVTALEKFEQLDARMSSPATHGKILDHHNTEFEFLSFASSPFTAAAMRWQRAEPIGVGSFGSVFKANSLDDFQVMAVKEVRISLNQSIKKVLKDIKDEMNVLEMVSHPNIVQYYGVEVHRERVYFFMEYCAGGSLAEILEDGPINYEDIVQFYSLQILEGLAYLHASGIVHRDIKPANILMKNNFIKIVDFGTAKIIEKNGSIATQTMSDRTIGTPMYMSPEVVTSGPSASLPSTDIWSFGCVLMQMLSGQLPWRVPDNNIFMLMYSIGHYQPYIPPVDTINPEWHRILTSCLQKDPSKRPSAMELLRDDWINTARGYLNKFMEMGEEFNDSQEFEYNDSETPSSVSTLNTGINNSQQTMFNTQELMQQQQYQEQELQRQQDNIAQQEYQPHEVMYASELASGYESHVSPPEIQQVTPMEPIVESDMEYEEQR